MESELLEALLRLNLAAGAAIALVLGLRPLIRAQFGARAAYALWLIVPIAAFSALAPPRVVSEERIAPTTRVVLFESAGDPSLSQASIAPVEDFAAVRGQQVKGAAAKKAPAMKVSEGQLLSAWLVGVFGYAALLLWRQRRFETALGQLQREEGRLFRSATSSIGPAVVGVFRPRIVLPADFEERFDAQERALILEHEAVHMAAGDSVVNFAVSLVQASCWFNPLVHFGAARLREDQELACDAAVMARFPKARRLYAEALVKAQGLAFSPPLANAWPAKPGSITSRILALKAVKNAPRRAAGLGVAVLLAGAAGAASWAAQPPVVVAKDIPAVEAEPQVNVYTPEHNAVPDVEVSAPVLADPVVMAAPDVSADAIVTVQPVVLAMSDRGGERPAMAPLTESPSYNARGVDVEEIAAILTVIPENRSDIAVEYSAGNRKLPEPRAYMRDGRLVVDGGLDLEDHPCTERFDERGVAKLPKVGTFSASELPRLVIHTPIKLDITVAGAVVANVGASAGGNIQNHGCGDMTIAGASGALAASLMGHGDVTIGDVSAPVEAALYGLGDLIIGNVGDANLKLYGVGDLVVANASGAVKGLLQGAGDLTIASVKNGADLDLPGAGDITVADITGPLNITSAGAGSIAIASLHAREAALKSWGATSIDIADGEVDNFAVDLAGSSSAKFGGTARNVKAVFSDAGGDFEIRDADKVDEVRNGVAAGSVKITG